MKTLGNRRRVLSARCLLAIAAAAGIAAASAVAATGYSLHVSGPTVVKTGSSFKIKVTGTAKHRSELYVYLMPRKCASDELMEYQPYKHGHSYFLAKGEGGVSKLNYYFAYVKGSFKVSATGHAGNITGHEYRCTYIVAADQFHNYQITAARNHVRYTVSQ